MDSLEPARRRVYARGYEVRTASRLRKNSMIASCVAFCTLAVRRQNSPQDVQTGRPARPQRTKRRIILVPYGEPLRFTSRGITRGTFVNAAEPVRWPCLARTLLAGVFHILLAVDEEAALVLQIGSPIEPFGPRPGFGGRHGGIVISSFEVQKRADTRISAKPEPSADRILIGSAFFDEEPPSA